VREKCRFLEKSGPFTKKQKKNLGEKSVKPKNATSKGRGSTYLSRRPFSRTPAESAEEKGKKGGGGILLRKVDQSPLNYVDYDKEKVGTKNCGGVKARGGKRTLSGGLRNYTDD